MKKSWYRARIRWAEMVERKGLRYWEEGVYLFRSEDREAAFRRALEIGEGGQSGGEEESRGRRRWVETRLAEVEALDCLGPELKEETSRGRCIGCGCQRPKRFRSITNLNRPGECPAGPGDGPGVGNFLEGPALR